MLSRYFCLVGDVAPHFRQSNNNQRWSAKFSQAHFGTGSFTLIYINMYMGVLHCAEIITKYAASSPKATMIMCSHQQLVSGEAIPSFRRRN